MDTDRNDAARKSGKTLAIIGGTLTFVSSAVYVGLCVWIAKGCPPVMPWFWHSLMSFCQRVAVAFGVWGMLAERAYAEALDGSRLS